MRSPGRERQVDEVDIGRRDLPMQRVSAPRCYSL